MLLIHMFRILTSDHQDSNNSNDFSFEKNLMPKLIEEHKRAGNKKIPFDKEKIKRRREYGGFGIQAWDEIFLQKRIDTLVEKRLIEDLRDGKYQISDLGIQRHS
jgi:hypothetical protein